MELLNGQVAIVTGGSQGIGREIGQVFAEQGATVVISDINEQGAEAAAKELRDAGFNAKSIKCDVTEAADVENLV